MGFGGKIKMDIEKLKESPMFNLSLSSKELFHSNFIDWLISVNKDGMSEVFSNLLKDEVKISKCDREKKTFDLYIECENDLTIIIENKFKSIITEPQLKEHNEKMKKDNLNDSNSRKLLLSLNFGRHERNVGAKCGWDVIDYTRLCGELNKLRMDEEYHRLLLKDYCEFVSEISRYFSESNTDLLKLSLPDMWEQSKKLAEIRLRDFYKKSLFHYLHNKILEELFSAADKPKNIRSWTGISGMQLLLFL